MDLRPLLSFFVVAALLSLPSFLRADRVVLIAGGGTAGNGEPATVARLVNPFGVGRDAAGNLYVVEMEGGERVLKITPQGRLRIVVGTGQAGFSGDGGPATKAQINGSHHLLVLPNGDLLIADTFNSRVRRVDHRTRIITTIAGTGERGFAGDGGLASKAQFGNLYCLALSPKGDQLYLCDLDNRRIRVVDLKTGIVTTVAGNGQSGVPEDGKQATDAPLVDPRAIVVDSRNNLYILERSGDALRVVTPAGTIRTLIGAPNHNPPAEIGPLKGPKHLCVDRKDNVLIADTDNHRILRYEPRTGRIQKIAGTGKTPVPGVSPWENINLSALEVNLNQPHGVFVAPDNTLYIADSLNGRVLHIVPR